MSTDPLLELNKICFSYGEKEVLRDLSLCVRPGQSLSIVGPSGQGKTTLLQLIAGDLKPKSGTMRRTGMWRRVHQTEALLPWLNVEENIRLGLRGASAQKTLPFDELVTLLNLRPHLKNYPRQLSGGLRQRTEIARALIARPEALLLDEPFSSLDYLIRAETREYLTGLLNQYPVAMVLVTHDLPEAVLLSQEVCLLRGSPAQITNTYETSSVHNEILVETIHRELRSQSFFKT
jgi:ABC-type nitrate/sulfonate/bicarbonate transport system ATPase subunit